MQHFYPLYLANTAHEGADEALEVVNKYDQQIVAEVARADEAFTRRGHCCRR